MKPRIGAYLSKRTATRLTAAAKRRGMTKSALVETAINHFLDFADANNAVGLTDRFADLSSQIDQLDRDLGIVSEIVGLHARFHLAVTPQVDSAAVREDGSARNFPSRPGGALLQVGNQLPNESR
jgi:predicted DNA-binding protein